MPFAEQELELGRLEVEQAQLEEQVALYELERETTITEVARFQKRYYDVVGRLYVELDSLLANMALLELASRPEDMAAQEAAQAAQEQARQSAEEAGLMEAQPEPAAEITPECRKAYRKAAMLMHPDRATTDAERERRTQMMARVNLAYESGDLAALEKLIIEFGEDPEAIAGMDIPSRLLKAGRRIAQLRRRTAEIEQELDELRLSGMFMLMTAVIDAEAKGDDPLGELAAQLLKKISRQRLACSKLQTQ